MLDIKLIRNQTDYVEDYRSCRARGTSYDADIDAVLERDDARRALIFTTTSSSRPVKTRPAARSRP